MAMTEAEYLAKASDPTATPEALEELWEALEPFRFPLENALRLRIQHTLARNPSLPPTLAFHCFGQLADSLAENPALTLLLLESPNLADGAPDETLLRMLRRPEAPSVLVDVLTRHKTRQVREAARLHVAVYGEASEEQVRQELATLPVGGKDKLLSLHSWALVPGWLAARHKLKARREPFLPPNLQSFYPLFASADIDPEPLSEAERMRVQALISAPPDAYLRHQLCPELQRALGELLTRPETLRLLAKERRFHDALGAYRATPLEILESLGDGAALIAHPDATQAQRSLGAARQLERVATVGLTVVLSLAHTCGDSLLHETALSSRWHRRLGAALNPRLTEKDRKRLVDDANAIVRAVARDTKLRDRMMDDGCDGAV